MLNDLAEAIRRWKEKKWLFFVFVICFVCVFFVGIVTANRTLYWSYLSSPFENHLLEDG